MLKNRIINFEPNKGITKRINEMNIDDVITHLARKSTSVSSIQTPQIPPALRRKDLKSLTYLNNAINYEGKKPNQFKSCLSTQKQNDKIKLKVKFYIKKKVNKLHHVTYTKSSNCLNGEKRRVNSIQRLKIGHSDQLLNVSTLKSDKNNELQNKRKFDKRYMAGDYNCSSTNLKLKDENKYCLKKRIQNMILEKFMEIPDTRLIPSISTSKTKCLPSYSSSTKYRIFKRKLNKNVGKNKFLKNNISLSTIKPCINIDNKYNKVKKYNKNTVKHISETKFKRQNMGNCVHNLSRLIDPKLMYNIRNSSCTTSTDLNKTESGYLSALFYQDICVTGKKLELWAKQDKLNNRDEICFHKDYKFGPKLSNQCSNHNISNLNSIYDSQFAKYYKLNEPNQEIRRNKHTNELKCMNYFKHKSRYPEVFSEYFQSDDRIHIVKDKTKQPASNSKLILNNINNLDQMEVKYPHHYKGLTEVRNITNDRDYDKSNIIRIDKIRRNSLKKINCKLWNSCTYTRNDINHFQNIVIQREANIGKQDKRVPEEKSTFNLSDSLSILLSKVKHVRPGSKTPVKHDTNNTEGKFENSCLAQNKLILKDSAFYNKANRHVKNKEQLNEQSGKIKGRCRKHTYKKQPLNDPVTNENKINRHPKAKSNKLTKLVKLYAQSRKLLKNGARDNDGNQSFNNKRAQKTRCFRKTKQSDMNNPSDNVIDNTNKRTFVKFPTKDTEFQTGTHDALKMNPNNEIDTKNKFQHSNNCKISQNYCNHKLDSCNKRSDVKHSLDDVCNYWRNENQSAETLISNNKVNARNKNIVIDCECYSHPKTETYSKYKIKHNVESTDCNKNYNDASTSFNSVKYLPVTNNDKTKIQRITRDGECQSDSYKTSTRKHDARSVNCTRTHNSWQNECKKGVMCISSNRSNEHKSKKRADCECDYYIKTKFYDKGRDCYEKKTRQGDEIENDESYKDSSEQIKKRVNLMSSNRYNKGKTQLCDDECQSDSYMKTKFNSKHGEYNKDKITINVKTGQSDDSFVNRRNANHKHGVCPLTRKNNVFNKKQTHDFGCQNDAYVEKNNDEENKRENKSRTKHSIETQHSDCRKDKTHNKRYREQNNECLDRTDSHVQTPLFTNIEYDNKNITNHSILTQTSGSLNRRLLCNKNQRKDFECQSELSREECCRNIRHEYSDTKYLENIIKDLCNAPDIYLAKLRDTADDTVIEKIERYNQLKKELQNVFKKKCHNKSHHKCKHPKENTETGFKFKKHGKLAPFIRGIQIKTKNFLDMKDVKNTLVYALKGTSKKRDMGTGNNKSTDLLLKNKSCGTIHSKSKIHFEPKSTQININTSNKSEQTNKKIIKWNDVCLAKPIQIYTLLFGRRNKHEKEVQANKDNNVKRANKSTEFKNTFMVYTAIGNSKKLCKGMDLHTYRKRRRTRCPLIHTSMYGRRVKQMTRSCLLGLGFVCTYPLLLLSTIWFVFSKIKYL